MTGMFKDELKQWDRPGHIKNWPHFQEDVLKGPQDIVSRVAKSASTRIFKQRTRRTT